MTEIKTLPDVWYTVTTENGCTIYRADGTRMLKEIEPGQGFFRAVENKVFCSDPDAIFRPFENAPRLKLSLLQGGAGGWLPKGFTELEYLESSGTQNIVLPTENISIVGRTWSQEVDMQFLSDLPTLVGWNSSAGLYWGLLNGSYSLGNNISLAADGNRHVFRAAFTRRGVSSDGSPHVSELTVNGQTVKRIAFPSYLPQQWLYGLFAPSYSSDGYAGSIRMWSSKCWSESSKFDLVPVLRNSDGAAGMWDKSNKQFFENAGTGTFGYRIKRTGDVVEPTTFSLRDPYYVAPSGVYARVNGENELELLSDTEETTGEGWEWFANTAEAYKHFGILLEEELLTE